MAFAAIAVKAEYKNYPEIFNLISNPACSVASSPVSLILLLPGFPENEQDTNCLPAVQHFAISFQRYYPEIKIFVIAFQYPFFRKTYRWNQIEVFSIGGKNSKFPWRFLTWLAVFRKVAQIKKDFPHIILQSFWITECAFVGHWLSAFFKVKHFAFAFGQDVKPVNRYLKLLDLKNISVIAASDFLSRKLLEQGCRTQKIIPMGTAFEFMDSADAGEKSWDITGIGSLIPLKNFSVFIEIIKELKKDFPGIKSCIAGKGEEKDKLEELIQKHQLEQNIVLMGEIPHPEIFSLLKKSRVFLHPSKYEGQSGVLLEALAAGIPAVCFDVGRAGAKDGIFVCETKEQMISTVKKLLKTEQRFHPVLVQPAKRMVEEFAALYGIGNNQALENPGT